MLQERLVTPLAAWMLRSSIHKKTLATAYASIQGTNPRNESRIHAHLPASPLTETSLLFAEGGAADPKAETLLSALRKRSARALQTMTKCKQFHPA